MNQAEELLNIDDTLRIRDRHGNEHVFKINGLKGRGGSAVCYYAECEETSEKGYLKEFFPLSSVVGEDVERDMTSNCLMIKDANGEFAELCENYKSAFKLMSQKRNEESSLINNYLPHVDIYQGSGSTLYIWTPEPVGGIIFEDYLQDIIKDPVDCCEHKLFNILSVIITAAKFIQSIHESGLLYLDMKPENMVVYYDVGNEFEYEINTGNISVFDINTIQLDTGRLEICMGTRGFSAPELSAGYADKASDIYSLGAMLFYAITVCKNGKEYVHQKYSGIRDYNRIRTYVQDSLLISGSDINSSSDVTSKLIKILRTSLSYNPKVRYENCKEIIDELGKVIGILAPNELAKRMGMNVDVSISDINDRLRHMNSDAPLRLLLWHRPLFDYMKEDSTTIDILVVGSDDIAFRFIDSALQCQIFGKRQRFTVVADSAEEAEKNFLEKRPDAARFININDNFINEKYASISFVSCGMKNNLSNDKLVTNIEEAIDKDVQYIYSFISLGRDSANRRAAKGLKSIVSGPVNYALTSKEDDDEMAVLINEDIRNLSDDPDFANMERMAFNTHVIWLGSNIDYKKEYKDFINNKYNYNASLRFALSIKYKLASLGLSLNSPGLLLSLNSQLSDMNKDIVYKLADLEHTRWMYAYICDGWEAPLRIDKEIDCDRCVDATLYRKGEKWKYGAKIMESKMHACLVQSSSNDSLSSFTDNEWKFSSESDEKLDDLDRLSVNMYRSAIAVLRERGYENPEDMVIKEDYKKYDIDLIKRLVEIIFSKPIEGLYEYVPEKPDTDFSLDKLSDKQIDKAMEEVVQYICWKLYSEGWRYGNKMDVARKKTPYMKRLSDYSDYEKNMMRRELVNILKILLKNL